MTAARYRFLFAAVILLLATANADHAQSALLAHYEFEGNLDDSSGNGHHGVAGSASGAAFFPQIVNDPERGQVLQTNANGSSFVNMSGTVPIPNFAPETSITMAAWIKRTHRQNASNFRYVVNLGANGNNPIATLGIHSEGYIAAYIETDEPINNGDQVNTFGSVVIEGNAAAWSTGGTLVPSRLRTIKKPRITGPPPTKSRNVGTTTLSVLNIQPTRNEIWCQATHQKLATSEFDRGPVRGGLADEGEVCVGASSTAVADI